MSPVKANAAALKEAQDKADAANKELSGVGLRHKAGQTRGKNPSVISWLAFNIDEPDTLPKTPKEFMDLTGVRDDAKLTGYLISGFNDEAYGLASDELYEYVEDNWPADIKQSFRTTVRQFAKMSGKSIEEVVALVKPSVEANVAALEAAAKAKEQVPA